jgi:hypothetical protein
MWAWIVRLIGGWIPIEKPFGEWLGKIIWVVGIVLVVLVIWNKFTAPTTTNNQKAEGIYNDYEQPKATFGCATVKTYKYFYGMKNIPSNKLK